jgi:hypothetical protein
MAETISNCRVERLANLDFLYITDRHKADGADGGKRQENCRVPTMVVP